MVLSEERLSQLRENAHDYWDEDGIFDLLVQTSEAEEERDRLRMELSKCNEQFDTLITEYTEARERWLQNMDRIRALNARFRPFVEFFATASLDEMNRLASSREWQDQARAALEGK